MSVLEFQTIPTDPKAAARLAVADRQHANAVLLLPAWLAEDDILAKLIAAAKDCDSGQDNVTAPFIRAATQELIDRGSKLAPPDALDPYRLAAEAAGWRFGGDDVIWNSKVFDSWKEAVSWSGDEEAPDQAMFDSATYSTWRECCEGEGIEVAA